MSEDDATAGDAETDADEPAAPERGDETGTRTDAAADAEAGAADEPADADAGDGEGLVARVAAHDEELADEVAELRERALTLEDERDERDRRIEELTEQVQRAKADFQNYKKRTQRRQAELEERATEDLVERLLDVRDNLQRAVDQEGDVGIREGVEATLREFDRVLAEENVSPIEPEPGAAVDPQRHEVLARVESDREPGTVAEVYRPGYEIGDRVLREAQITVSEDGA